MTAAECMEKIEKLESVCPLPKDLYIAYVKDARPKFGAMYAKLWVIGDDGVIQSTEQANAVITTLWNTFSSLLPMDVWEYMMWDVLAMRETLVNCQRALKGENMALTVKGYYKVLERYNAESAEVFKNAVMKD